MVSRLQLLEIIEYLTSQRLSSLRPLCEFPSKPSLTSQPSITLSPQATPCIWARYIRPVSSHPSFHSSGSPTWSPTPCPPLTPLSSWLGLISSLLLQGLIFSSNGVKPSRIKTLSESSRSLPWVNHPSAQSEPSKPS